MEIQDLHSYARLLNSFNTHKSIPQGQQLHLLFLKRGVLFSTLNIANRVLQMYVRCGEISCARKMFDEMTQRNSFTWNTVLEGCAKSGDKNDLLNLFLSMPYKNEFSWNVVISRYAKAGELDVARRLFNEMPSKNGIAWNAMIHGYAKNGYPRMALRLFQDLLNSEIGQMGSVSSLDMIIYTTAVGACTDLGSLDWGKQVHSRMIVDGMEFDSVLGSSLVNMYGKCSDLDSASDVLNAMKDPDDYSMSALISGFANCCRVNEARRIFELMTNPCVVIWNSIIAGYIANDDPMEAILLFDRMHKEGVRGDSSTMSSVLSACSSIGILKNCTQLHSHVYKLGIMFDLVVASAFIDVYAKCGSPNDACNLFRDLKTYDTVLLNSMITIYSTCGRVEEAKCIFNSMPLKSLISWNAMIVGLSQNGLPIEALDIFCKMNKMNMSMDKFSIASVISACASIALIELGEQVFARATIIGLDFDQIIATSLIDFYCKCGYVRSGRKLFDQVVKFDEVSWNSMLMGYAVNGYGIEALSLFCEMRCAGVLPTNITFTAVLSACDHCGLVQEGKNMFHIMKHDYHIDPVIEHYSCMIDLLARVGCPQEAIDLIDQMPFKADASMWLSILRGCLGSGDKPLAKKVARQIMDLDSKNSGALVQLSSILASAGDWEQSALVRKLMADKRIQKNPGRSWCDV
ncbi:pentatricopeptide repeat-containing At1g77010, mitochondrial [Olea europaea subsp. europaea]|uniref:Pentatricopeptide repeat-containing At1g77010, mitochondrial n=1 Tax=Olea europaea subsp. europaea TaxID=158383 RepID=A0A8S0UDB3_OLEEU|nr:pentatricopeptide repeat-containing At1g77010, mitochondrial [Olea europaea subsp. europaea]